MHTIDILRRSGVGIGPDRTMHDAAALMEQSGVGSLAIVDDDHRLIGIVTDRDIVRRGVARGLPGDARIDGLMSSPVVTISSDADVHDAFSLFRTHAVRRLAVTSGDRFVGMITIDDLLIDLAADLADLARPVTAEAIFSHRDSPVPVTR